DLFVKLSRALWSRADRAAVDVIRDCVVELPNALLLRGRRTPTPAARERIAASVRAIVALGPPPTDTPPASPPPTTPPPPAPHRPTTTRPTHTSQPHHPRGPPMTPTLTHHEDIAVLTLGSDENRFSPDRLDALNAHLDEVEKSAKGLVTVGSGKFYSNGLDL